VSVSNRRPPRPPIDWAALQYRPSGAPLLRCARRGCGASYVDDEPSRAAHVTVFGHSPRTSEPANPPNENPP
jgi:hypothetical protein